MSSSPASFPTQPAAFHQKKTRALAVLREVLDQLQNGLYGDCSGFLGILRERLEPTRLVTA